MVTPLDLPMTTESLTPGDETELSANLIAVSMYANYDPDGHQYFILDSIIDHRRLDTAMKLTDTIQQAHI
jgi:hypothetical protein